MKSWKTRWKSELDERIPELKPEIMNAPIVTASDGQEERIAAKEKPAGIFERLLGTVRGKRAFVGALAAVAVVICVCLGVFLRPTGGKAQVSAFALEINPKAAFSVSADGVVTNAVALNADADVILSNEECLGEIIGKSRTEAARAFVDCAARLGFVNLSDGDAVKVVGCDSAPDDVADAIKGYFMDKGSFVVVLSEKVNVESFCDLGGFSVGKTLEKTIEGIAGADTIFSKREADGVEGSELAELYERVFGEDGRIAALKKFLLDSKSALESGIEAVGALIAKNEEIEAHEDNPNLIVKDYWSVLSFGNDDYTEQFGALMGEMQHMLDSYISVYGVQIEGLVALQAMGSFFAEEIVEVVTALIERFDFDVFASHLEGITRLFGYVGCDIESASNAPTTTEEYLCRINDYFEYCYEEMTAQFAEIYEEQRERISRDSYDNYINNVIAQYGSLEQFWQAQKNN